MLMSHLRPKHRCGGAPKAPEQVGEDLIKREREREKNKTPSERRSVRSSDQLYQYKHHSRAFEGEILLDSYSYSTPGRSCQVKVGKKN